MIRIYEKKNCTGCSACVNICPVNAITFAEDTEGFNYPIVNEKKCINCEQCNRICPIINTVKVENNYIIPKVYASWNIDEEVRINSTSGGVFSAIAEKFIDENGIVVGAEYTEDFSIRHTFITDKEGIARLRQSKYAQSDLSDVFKKIKKLLTEGKKILFCGTPCQVAGLKSFLKKDYDNMYLCDFICRGIASQKVYKKYLLSVQNKMGATIKKIQFKNKDFGWNLFSTKIELNSGEFYHKDRYNDEYMVGYLKYNLFIRPACHSCKFKKLPRVSDITLGDFWGIGEKSKELDSDKGTSVVLLNTKKGENLFEKIREKTIICEECYLEDVVKGNTCLFNTVPEGNYRNYFFNHIENEDFIDLIHKIINKAVWERNDLSFKDRIYLIKKRILKK